MAMKHLVMMSGGLASFDAAHLAIQKYGGENVDFLFTDTQHEDKDLYRFLIESAHKLRGTQPSDEIQEVLGQIGNIWEDGEEKRRKITLDKLASLSQEIPGFFYRSKSETLWESFYRHRAIGNSRLQFCSEDLKITPSTGFIRTQYGGNVTLHFGLDYSETRRMEKVVAARSPLSVSWDYHNSLRTHSDARELAESMGIVPPDMYALGFTHNNCSGFCVKAGQKHFAHVLSVRPELYYYAERREEELRQFLGKDVAILKTTSNGRTSPLTLKNLRSRLEEGKEPDYDLGECGCFI